MSVKYRVDIHNYRLSLDRFYIKPEGLPEFK